MMHLDLLHPSTSTAHAVYLEPEGSGVNPRTRVRALVSDGRGIRETIQVFDTLDEALAYAQTFCPPAA